MEITSIRPSGDLSGGNQVEIWVEGYVLDDNGEQLPPEVIASGYFTISNGPLADMTRLTFTGNKFSFPIKFSMTNNSLILMWRHERYSAEYTLTPQVVFAGELEPITWSMTNPVTLIRGTLYDAEGKVIIPSRLLAGGEAKGAITIHSDNSFSLPVIPNNRGLYSYFILETTDGDTVLARARSEGSRISGNILLLNSTIKGPLENGKVYCSLTGSARRTPAAAGELYIQEPVTRREITDAIQGEVNFREDWFNVQLALEPGTYEVVWLGDFDLMTATFTVVPEMEASFVLPNTALDDMQGLPRLIGTIVDTEGKPIVGDALLQARGDIAAWIMSVKNGTIDHRVPSQLPAGEYELTLIHDGYKARPVSISIERRAAPAYVRYTIGQTAYDANGVIKHLTAAPMLYQSHTVIPVRALDAIGVVSNWDNDTRTATFVFGSNKVELVLNSPIAKVNGKEVTMPIPAFSSNGRTMAPFRFVGESLGLMVHWNWETQEVTLTER
ncbi:MAG: copper amine oxidase N-terminal domain-containing protein [Firmicutes bacterium]|nr:copper amine oxidase N-terminal domain-containing protein [Bacillota bacterium]